ncbi:GntR family transcriptional regulator [Pengzhenrongella frigida]|uniref:GntR family transcriptional regulator n=1 Tax=Pengzhenrongella frigida TaxID=1259133 RepID=A0A4Q5N009_9MICO|nr:GntR family transcriptional regulator [Cellulomonas sp. HLT2-17]RYV51336.1 GntR family transcriptional regulator [Cellulomonas sp. HLT2-17]
MLPTSPSAADVAYRYVKELVLDDRLPGGSMISEGQIAGQLTVSRTPVREAFLRLEAEGWLRLYPKRGAVIVPIAAGEARAVVDARLLLEVHAVESLATADDRARLRAALESSIARQSAALDDGDLEAYSRHDTEFHLAIVAAGGNALLTSFCVSLRERQHRMTARSLWRDVERARGFVRGHAELAVLVGAGDVPGFGAALRRHLRDAHLVERAADAATL